MTRRWTWLPRFWPHALAFMLAPVGVGVLGQVWEVKRVDIVGVRRFDPAAARRALEDALGKPPILASASALRQRLLTVPWVEDAQVAVGLDGTVRCAIVERTPEAVVTDREPWQLVDASGRLLGPASGEEALPRLSGFAPYPEERAHVLALLPTLAEVWGEAVVSCQRLGAREVAVSFASGGPVVVLDPRRPEGLRQARQVLAAWEGANLGPLSRLDVRVVGRVFVQPAVGE